MSRVFKAEGENRGEMTRSILDSLLLKKKISKKPIVIKPNLTIAKPYPVTTPPETVEAIVKYLKELGREDITIAEGSGGCETTQAFKELGYEKLARQYSLSLVDLNKEKVVVKKNPQAYVLKEFPLPETLTDCFLISVAVLKEHGDAKITACLKNMIGIAPAPYYSHTHWKGLLHDVSIHKAIVDINLYKKPDVSIIDAITAQRGGELSGTPLKLGVFLGSCDPVACDSAGCEMLGINPKLVPHIILAEEKQIGTISHQVRKARTKNI